MVLVGTARAMLHIGFMVSIRRFVEQGEIWKLVSIDGK